jgi:hypothetical protein
VGLGSVGLGLGSEDLGSGLGLASSDLGAAGCGEVVSAAGEGLVGLLSTDFGVLVGAGAGFGDGLGVGLGAGAFGSDSVTGAGDAVGCAIAGEGSEAGVGDGVGRGTSGDGKTLISEGGKGCSSAFAHLLRPTTPPSASAKTTE